MSNFINDIKTKVYCRLGVSKIHGVGVFAIKSIPKGINPMEEMKPCEFEIVSGKEMRTSMLAASPEFKQLIKDFCPERPEDDEWDCPAQGLNSIGIAWYLNHSDKPNIEESGGNFYALRPIDKGEELTVNYGTYGALNL